MTFISYAQNYEDVMLWRALKHIQKGFYIDVGAAWPDQHSVTRLFYLNGWRGINIEPNQKFIQLLNEQRQEDTNLQVAVGDREDRVMIEIISDTGLSTISKMVANAHKEAGRTLHAQEVPLTTMASIFDKHIKPEQDIHFLKVDVEGLEAAVLRGNDWTTCRPWIVVVEATLPLTQTESYTDWEPILIDAAYSFAYADGLNRFYVADEHAELQKAFKYPPNVFDDFVPISQQQTEARVVAAEAITQQAEARVVAAEAITQQAEARVSAAEAITQQAEARAGKAEATTQQAEARVVAAENLVQAITSSRSWKITAPLRLLSGTFRWFKAGVRAWVGFVPGSRPRRIVKSCLVLVGDRIKNRPALLNLASRVLSHSPQLKERLRRTIVNSAKVESVAPDSFIELVLTPSSDTDYALWIKLNSFIPQRLLDWNSYPENRLSILLPYDLDDIQRIDQTLKAVQAQGCPHWQVLLAPFGDAGMHTAQSRFSLEAGDTRILWCTPRARRGEALRAAAEIAEGALILVLEPGDVLPTHAVSTFVTRMGESPDLLILYADEDVIESGLRRTPQLKPSWSPELLRSYNYFGRPTVIRKSTLTLAGSFSSEAGAAAEWDLWLRVSERFMDRVATPCIDRETQVLCHRHPTSSNGRAPKDWAQGDDFKECLRKHWERLGRAAHVTIQPDGTLHAEWEIENPPLVSVIIPNKNRANLLNVSLAGLWDKTAYSRMEIIVVDNGSTEQDTLELYAAATVKGVRIVDFNEPFNYSRACNRGAAVATGDLLLFLNNDIEVTHRDWLTELVRHTMLPGVGVVGTKLVYPDGVLQHSGVVLGMHVCGLVFHRGEEFGWGPFGSPSVTRNWMGIMGACQMIRRTVFDRVGGFDETYQVAMSDIKLSIDAWRAGYRTVNVPMAKLIHHEGASRGKSNPREDIKKAIRDIYAKGLEDDGYFHPGLSAIPAVPTLRRPGEHSTVESLAEHYSTMIGDSYDTRGVDLFDDRSMSRASGRPGADIVWIPDPAGVIDGPASAARFMIDLLRGRTDIRERFPLALTEGAQGEFAIWLKNEGLDRFGFTADAAYFIDSAFNQRPGDRAKQAMLFEYELRDKEPYLFMPGRTHLLARSLFGLVATDHVSKESTWWLLLEMAEDPVRSLIESWQHSSILQEQFPNGITRFGREHFARCVKETLNLDDDAWLNPSIWPDVYPAADQVRLAYLSNTHWQTLFPQAMHDDEACENFLEFLNSPEGTIDRAVANWLSTLDRSELRANITQSGINLFGHFSYPSGLRTSAESVGKSLLVQGIRSSLINVPVSLRNDEVTGSMLAGLELFDVSIVHVQPEPFFPEIRQRSNIAKRKRTPYQIGYWYWEFDSIPPSWDAAAEECDELWTATEFIAKGLRERYRKPVHVLFPGVELPDFQRYPRQHYGLPEDAYIFLFAFHMTSITERKNPLGLMRAFKKAFPSGQNAALLLIKTSFGSTHPNELQRLMDEARGANIRIIDEVYSIDETLSLFDVSDVYVSLHRSEGLGLTMAEAMLMGKPTIGTRFSGNLDFMNDSNSLLVDYEPDVLKKAIPPYSAGLTWANPSEDQAAAYMRKLFDDRQFAKDLGARAKKDLERRLCYETTGKGMAARVHAISCDRARQFS